MQVGCHMSVSAGFAKMLERAKELGADVVQYFPKNPKSYRLKKFDREKLEKEWEKSSSLQITTVCHSPYVTNLATPKPDLRETSIASIVNDLEIAEAYHTPYLVVHCGKHVGQGVEEGRANMISATNEVLQRYTGPVQFLIENTAGMGSDLGGSIEDLLAIVAGLDEPERVGFCFDTCHAYAAGLLDFDHWEETVAALTSEDFGPKVKVLHLNDSKAPFDSHKDRHELLGEGEIGKAFLERFLQAEPFGDIPIVIETPVEKEADYAGEISRTRFMGASSKA